MAQYLNLLIALCMRRNNCLKFKEQRALVSTFLRYQKRQGYQLLKSNLYNKRISLC